MKNKLKDNKGFSLLENLVYVALIASITTIFMAITADVMRNAGMVHRAKDAQQNSRFILSRISQEVKTAKNIANVSPGKLIITNKDSVTVFFEYDAANKAVIYNNGTESQVLSGRDINVNQLVFSQVSSRMVRTEVELTKETFGSWGGAYEIKGSVLALPRSSMY